jgi:hypothetical protein
MSDASGEGGSDQASPFPSDSEGAGGGGGAAAGASSDDGGSDGGDDGFEGRVASETRADHKSRLYTVIDRQSLLRMQVCAPLGGVGRHLYARCIPGRSSVNTASTHLARFPTLPCTALPARRKRL